MTGRPSDDEVQARVDERDDLLDRLDAGESAALGELFEHVSGAKVAAVKVTLPHHALPQPTINGGQHRLGGGLLAERRLPGDAFGGGSRADDSLAGAIGVPGRSRAAAELHAVRGPSWDVAQVEAATLGERHCPRLMALARSETRPTADRDSSSRAPTRRRRPHRKAT